MNVHLDERAIPDDFEAVNLTGLDNENVPSATFKVSPFTENSPTLALKQNRKDGHLRSIAGMSSH
jgi:hypothetical protein